MYDFPLQVNWRRILAHPVAIAVLVGIICGLSALAFLEAIQIFNTVLLRGIATYIPPSPGGETGSPSPTFGPRFFLVPAVTLLGGLIAGFLVYRFAPEAEGVGTDQAIKAFHEGDAIIRPRVPLLKLLASALTIGSGGTSGREGPIAQIGAGAGSAISSYLKLDRKTRQTILAAGLGAGIASIFKAPLAGAIIGAEIFYTRDFEVEALIPGFVASVVGYSIVGYATGWQPIFATGVSPVEFRNPLSLPLFSLLGLVCAGFALLLFRVYYPTINLFRLWKAPLYVKTAIGGLMTGLLALVFPSVLGVGYGWVQLAINQQDAIFSPMAILLAAFAEIFSLSFTLGSGGSGGIFGPSVVTGGLIGASVGYVFFSLFPGIVPSPSDFAIVGMMAFFAADGKAPLSTIVLVAEMTGGYGLLAPSMFAVTPAFLLSGSRSVFPSQLPTRRDSPSHREEYRSAIVA